MSHGDNEVVCPGCMLTKMMLYRNAPEAQLVLSSGFESDLWPFASSHLISCHLSIYSVNKAIKKLPKKFANVISF